VLGGAALVVCLLALLLQVQPSIHSPSLQPHPHAPTPTHPTHQKKPQPTHPTQPSKVARTMAPSVIYMDEVEKVFVTDKKRAKEFGGQVRGVPLCAAAADGRL